MPASAESGELEELLLSPLEQDYELKHVLQNELRERLAHMQPGRRDDTAEQATVWLRKQPRPPRKKRWLLLGLSGVALLAAVAAFLLQAYKLIPLAAANRIPILKREAARQTYDLPPEEAPYVISADFDIGPAAAAKRGWDAHPDDPVLYYAYVSSSMSHSLELPRGFEETWQKIDPDNGMWLLMQAASLCPRGGPPATTSSEFQQVLELMRAAGAKPRIQFYEADYQKYLKLHRRPLRSAAQAAMRLSDASFSRFTMFGSSMFNPLESMLGAVLPALPPSAPERPAYTAVNTALGLHSAQSMDELSRTSGRSDSLEKMIVRTALIYGFALGLSGMCCSLLFWSSLSGLRLLPAQGRPGRVARCLRQLLRPSENASVLLWAIPIPVSLMVVCFAQISPVDNEGSLVGTMAIPAGFAAILLGMVDAARRSVSHRVAFLGFGSSQVSRILTPLMLATSWLSVIVLAGWLAYSNNFHQSNGPGSESTRFDSESLAEGQLLVICGGLSGIPVLYVILKGLLGYAFPDANVRHRLIALRLLPGFFIAAAFFALVSLALNPFEAKAAGEIERLLETESQGARTAQ